MPRLLLLLPLALSCSCVAEEWNAMSAAIRASGSSVGVAVSRGGSNTVGLGPVDKDWAEVMRYELYFRNYYPAKGGVEPFFDAAVFSESQSYDDVDGRIDADTFGLALSFGGVLRPFQNQGQQAIGLGVVPYVRFGIGSNDVYVRDLEYEGSTVSGSDTVARIDFGGGADVQMSFGRHIEAAVGGGINFWSAANVSAVSTDQGTLIRVNRDLDFDGHDLFLRASFGFSF